MTIDNVISGELELPQNMPWDAPGGSLDEVHDEDIPTPRLRIIPKEAVFENADTGEKYDKLEVIILGLVRSRVMWPKEVEEDSVPMCKSLDAEHGMPNIDDNVAAVKQFPWKKSNFVRSELPVVDDQPIAPCKECKFAEWDEENKRFPCTEQLNLPVFYQDKYGNMAPAVLTFASSGFSATMRYLGAIKSMKGAAPFMFYTTINLEARHNMDVDYAVPKFHKGDMTDRGELIEVNGKMVPETWAFYHQSFLDIKTFLRQMRMRRTEGDVAASEPVEKQAEKVGAPVPDYIDAQVEEQEEAAF